MSKMLRFCMLQVGKPYVFGRSGPDAYDCSGLTKRAAAQIGLDLYHGATTQWNRGQQPGEPDRYAYFREWGLIDDLPVAQEAVLFNQDKQNPRKMAHVGYYDGRGGVYEHDRKEDGAVVQAGGYGGRGVHYNPLDRRRWSHYAVYSVYWMERNETMADDPILHRGSIGDAVKKMQLALIALGYNVGKNTRADGKFGPATEAAVRAFQVDYQLPVTGTWGPGEEQAIDRELEEELGPPDNDDEEMILVPRGLLEQLSSFLA